MDNHYLLILLGVVFIFTLVIFKLLLDKNWTTKIQSGFVPKDQYNQLNHSLTEKESVISALDQSLNALRIDITLKEEQLRSQDEMIDYKMREIEGIRETTRKEFELLAQKIFEEKSSRFTETNKANIEILLKPLKENIQQFESRIHQQFTEEFKSRSELKKEIELLKTHSDQMSREANNLAVAIKGDKKLLGDWGEIQLETILQHSGLEKNVHYKVQMSIKDEEGNDKRPDFVVFLPDKKCIIIDSKVSLVAYEKYFNADADDERQKFLKQHIQDVRNHIKGLATKSYQSLPGLQNPEYVLLFIPLEPAFNVVVQYDSRIFMEALDQNIVLVTSTTLMATMRTVYHIWRQQQQNMNAEKIARESGMLYDKFVGFVQDMTKIGDKIRESQGAYQDAMNKLTESSKKGDTIIGRVERIKKLGARASKSIPGQFLADAGLQENTEGE